MIIISRLQSERSVTYFEFIDILRKLWKAAGHPGEIIRNAPKKDATYPIITFKCGGRTINPQIKDLKPRLRATIPHPDIPDEFIEVYGQVFDVYMDFNIIALNPDEADQLMFTFDDFMRDYIGYFRSSGIQDLKFIEQGPDEEKEIGGFTVHIRPLRYLVRFEYHSYKVLGEIQHMAIVAGIVTEEELKEENTYGGQSY